MRRTHRVIDLAAGGTGGHLQPALALGEELERRHPDWRFRFLVAGRSVERVFLGDHEVIELFPGRGSRPSPGRLDQWGRAVARAFRERVRERPDLVVMAGGYVSLVAAVSHFGVPWVSLEPDRVPGRVARLLRPAARRVLRQWPSEGGRDGSRLRITGMPLRWRGFPERAAARRELGLDLDRPTVLVLGGSQGARAVNDRMLAGRESLRRRGVQVVHVSGEADLQRARELYAAAGVAARVDAFRDDMPRLYAAADLVVARAGGMTVAEVAAAGRAAVFVPYPHHADDHQSANARMLEEAGAAALVSEESCPVDEFVDREVVPRFDEPEQLRTAERRARELGKPRATSVVADVLEELLAEGRPLVERAEGRA